MLPTILFSLSALCFVAMLKPGKSTRPAPKQPGYTYYVCDNSPMPTWKRKIARLPRVSEPVG